MATLYAVLDRIRAQFAIANAITHTDFARAERLIGQYVDDQLAYLRTH